MSKSIEALNRIETVVPFNRENKTNYYRQFMQSETQFYEDFDLVKKDLDRLEKLEKFIKLIKTKRCCLNEISPSSWNDRKVYEEMCNYDYYLFTHEINYYSLKNKERILTQEEFNLIKEVLDDEK